MSRLKFKGQGQQTSKLYIRRKEMIQFPFSDARRSVHITIDSLILKQISKVKVKDKDHSEDSNIFI